MLFLQFYVKIFLNYDEIEQNWQEHRVKHVLRNLKLKINLKKHVVWAYQYTSATGTDGGLGQH